MEKIVEKALEKLTEKFTDTFIEYLQDQLGWQTGKKDDLKRLQRSLPKIKSVFSAASQVRFTDQNSGLYQWILQLHVAIEEANALLNKFIPNQAEEQPIGNEETMLSFIYNILCRAAKRMRVFLERAIKIDPDLNNLEEVLQKFDTISADANFFLQLIESRMKEQREQREQQVESRKARETGCFPTNDLIDQDEIKKKVIQWLMEVPQVDTTTTLYRNISVLSVVGDSCSGKTTLLQHVYADEILSYEFDLKMWVCVSDNFDVKKIIADMLESLETKRLILSSLAVLQNSLKREVKYKKFLLVLDGLDEERDVSKLKNVLSCLHDGGLGSKILITTRKDSVASLIAKIIGEKSFKLHLYSLGSEPGRSEPGPARLLSGTGP